MAKQRYPTLEIIIFSLVMIITFPQSSTNSANNLYSFTLLPTNNYIDINGSFLTRASPQACYADCQSCQILTNLCQQCYVPYFSKTPQGTCALVSSYTVQSSSNQIRSGAAFSLAAESWSNYALVNCSSLNNRQTFQGDLLAIQPSPQASPLIYNRTVSIHNYLTIRFMLITSNWNNSTVMNIQLYNQANKQIIQGGFNVSYLQNVPKQSLCSSSNIDQRFSVTIQLQDKNTTALSIRMGISGQGQFSISTFALLSGLCDATCSSCSYSNDPKACLGCNYFLTQITDGSCSQCPVGFRFIATTTYSYCQKCPIQYQSCTNSKTTCFYPELNATTTNNCSLTYNNSFYSQQYLLNQQTFAGSLFTVGGGPSPSLYIPCGSQSQSSYTYIGPAGPFQPITRLFVNQPHHLALSLSFNVFVVDASYQSRNSKFQIYINGQLYDVRYLTIPAMSNVCGGDQLQSFITFPPTEFYQNNFTDYNLTILSDTTWGLRNLRIVYQLCDKNCLLCGNNGCQRCVGLLQVQNGICQNCPQGFGMNSSTNASQMCFKCNQHCLKCSLNNGKEECLLCSAPFFLYQSTCRKRTNVGDTITPSTPTPPNSSSSTPTLTSTTCNLSLPTSTSALNQTTNFILSTSTLTTVTTISQPHYRSIVQFYLIRVGIWDPSDRLDIYLNDLLMLSKTYNNYGNKYCSQANDSQTDYLSFQSLDFTDYNNSLSIYFQLVSVNNTPRTFGVANLKVYPVGCQSCLTYPFSYKIQYNYDETLNVVVSFSRVYQNTNVTLFKIIFILILNGQQLPYEIISNNSVIYTLQAYPKKDTLLGTLQLKCLYPELVTTSINNSINGDQPFFSRLLQSTNLSSFSNSKTIDNQDSSTSLVRYTPIQNPSAINGIRIFFQIVSRFVIYVGFALFFFGLQTIATHFMHNLQKIWLHIFLAALAAPALLRETLTGFRQVQNQNIAVNPSSWQSGLPTELYYTSDSYFYRYYTDVNFFRNIYNIAVAFAVFLLYLLIMHIVTKKYITRQMTENNNFYRHLKVTFHRRPYFYLNSLIFYQYLSLILASMLQFTSLTNKTDQGSFTGISATAAIIAFILGTIYPIVHFLWIRHKQEYLGRLLHIQFANRYHEIFWRFVKRDIWDDKQITYAQRFYNLYRFGQLWWYCLIVTALAYNPQAQLYLLLITQAVHLFIVLYTKLSRSFFFRICKVLQLAFFVGLEIIMLVCQSQTETLTERSYNTLGGVAIGFIFAIVLLSVTRSIYNAYLLAKEYKYKEMKDKIHTRQGQVMRRDQYYASDEEAVEEIPGTDRV